MFWAQGPSDDQKDDGSERENADPGRQGATGMSGRHGCAAGFLSEIGARSHQASGRPPKAGQIGQDWLEHITPEQATHPTQRNTAAHLAAQPIKARFPPGVFGSHRCKNLKQNAFSRDLILASFDFILPICVLRRIYPQAEPATTQCMQSMGMEMTPTYTYGIEEEYFIYQRKNGDSKRSMSTLFFEEAKLALGDHVTRELLQSQIEVATTPLTRMSDGRAQLLRFRRTLDDLAAKHGLGILAAGTHPTANWEDQRPTEQMRYGRVANDLQMLARRKLICGMHVHVEVPEETSRVDLMVRLLPYVPLFLALSTSSPFWNSNRTGLMAYRQALYEELPRSGLPDLFRSEAEYDSYVAALVDNRVMADASYIWWVVRPSAGLPTLELRVADACTRVDDAIAIAALYRSLVRRLVNDPGLNLGLTPAARAIIDENKWRAQRYGIHGSLIDLNTGTALPVALVLADLIELVRADAEALGCLDEVEDTRLILERGTSADEQLAVYRDALTGGASQPEALNTVVDWIAATTRH